MTPFWIMEIPPHHNHFMALFPGPPRSAGARRELLDFMVQGKINRGRNIDHPAERQSIWTNQCSPPPSPHFLQDGCPSCHPTNNVKAMKARILENTKGCIYGRDIHTHYFCPFSYGGLNCNPNSNLLNPTSQNHNSKTIKTHPHSMKRTTHQYCHTTVTSAAH